MSKLIKAAALAGFGLALALGASAQARTDDETKAIVLKFNNDAFANGDKDALPNEISDDFIEHHPTGAAQTPESTHDEFLARFGKKRAGGGGGAGGPPPPALVLVSGDYVMFMTKMQQKDPTAPGKTYEADWFDLFRVNDAGKVAEHWDSGTVMKMPPGGGAPPG